MRKEKLEEKFEYFGTNLIVNIYKKVDLQEVVNMVKIQAHTQREDIETSKETQEGVSREKGIWAGGRRFIQN